MVFLKDAIIFVLLQVQLVFSSTCPLNGLSSQTTESKCYYFLSAETNFLVAEDTCQQLNGHLASVCNPFENLELMQASKQFLSNGDKDFWIGYNNLTDQSHFNWTDPNSACSTLYTNWNGVSRYEEFLKYCWYGVGYYPEHLASFETSVQYCLRFKGGLKCQVEGYNNTDGSCVAMSISSGKWQTVDCTIQKPFVCEVFMQPETTKSAPTKPAPTLGCKAGYTYNNKTNFCYKLVSTHYEYDQAEWNCINEGGHLASILTPEENKWIDGITVYPDITSFWIGLYLPGFSMEWFWKDGNEFSYNSWGPGQPSNQSSCTFYLSSEYPKSENKTWWVTTLPCNESHLSLCKQSPICV